MIRSLLKRTRWGTARRDMGQQQALLQLTMDVITFPHDASIEIIMSTTTMFYTIDVFSNVVPANPIQSAPAMWLPIRMRSPVPVPIPLEALQGVSTGTGCRSVAEGRGGGSFFFFLKLKKKRFLRFLYQKVDKSDQKLFKRRRKACADYMVTICKVIHRDLPGISEQHI